MSIVPLKPLAQRREAWLTLPSLSRWLTCTIRLGYAIQFARRPPKFNGVLETSVAVRNAPVLHEEIAVLLAKDAIEPVPPAERRQGFYSPNFIIPKKRGGLRPILDLQVLNRALHKLPFKMRTRRRIIKCIQSQDWFAAIDLKDAYFHVSILLRHRPFLRFAFEGPPLWALPVSPCVHEGRRRRPYPITGGGCQDPQLPRRLAYPSPIQRAVGRSQGIGAPAPQPVGASGQLGKEQALPCAENLFSRCRVRLCEYDGTPHGGTCPSSAELPEFLQRPECGTTETGQRLLGHMASTAAVTPLGLLYMRPLQLWLHSRAPRWAWRCGTLRVGITQQCRRFLSPWTDLAFLRAGVPLEQVFWHTVVTTITPHVTARPPFPSHNDHTACHSSPAISSSGVPRSSSHCALFISRGSSIVRPTRIVFKLREDEEQVLLVAPHWPTQTWFPELITLMTAPPWRIPLRRELLSQGLGTIWHPCPDLWNLHVWLLDRTRQTWVVYHQQW